MTRAEFLRTFEDTVTADPGSITGDELLETLENWDSVAVVVFIAQADEHFSVDVSRADLLRCRTVNDLLRLLGLPANEAVAG